MAIVGMDNLFKELPAMVPEEDEPKEQAAEEGDDPLPRAVHVFIPRA